MARHAQESDEKSRSRRISEILGLISTVLVLATAYLGLLTARATQENRSLETSNEDLRNNIAQLRQDNADLATTIDESNSEIAALQEQVARLEAQRSPDQPSPTESRQTTNSTGSDQRLVSLVDLDQVDGEDANTDPVEMLGVDYREAITIDLETCGMEYADFPLGRKFSRFTAAVGLNDTTETPKTHGASSSMSSTAAEGPPRTKRSYNTVRWTR